MTPTASANLVNTACQFAAMIEACLNGYWLIMLRIFQLILQYICTARVVQPFKDRSLEAIRHLL